MCPLSCLRSGFSLLQFIVTIFKNPSLFVLALQAQIQGRSGHAASPLCLHFRLVSRSISRSLAVLLVKESFRLHSRLKRVHENNAACVRNIFCENDTNETERTKDTCLKLQSQKKSQPQSYKNKEKRCPIDASFFEVRYQDMKRHERTRGNIRGNEEA